MRISFDIFRADEGGILWVEAARDLDTAKARVQAIGPSSPGTYVILNHRTGEKIAIEVARSGVAGNSNHAW